MTLRRPLVLLILAAFLPMFVLSASLGVVALRRQQAAIETDAIEGVRRLSAAIARELSSQVELLRVVADSRDFDRELTQDEFSDMGRRLGGVVRTWRALRLSDPQGNVVFDAPPDVTQSRIADLESHVKAVESRQAVIGRVLRGPRGRNAFAIRAPVIRGGEVKYVLSAVVEPDSVRDLLLNTGVPREWVATVVDGDGYIVARTQGPSSFVGELASALARSARESGTEGIYTGLTIEGIDTLSAFHRLPIGNWSVHIGVPRDIFMAPVYRSRWLLGSALAGTLVLVGIFLWLLAREIRLRRQEEVSLEGMRRLEALGRMTGGVAHDFNNLLMIMQGSAEAIKRRRADVEKHQTYAEAILTAVQRGQALTRQLLAFARRGAHEPISFRLQDRAADLESLLSRSVRDNVQVRLSIPSGTWPLRADPNALEVALINLAVNASDAMSDGGPLLITANNVSLRTGRDSNTGLTGDFVAISVTDVGSGIPEEHLDRIFEPFYTTKATGKGTGLGLSQVYGFAQQSGGTVTVTTKVGAGSTFTLFLPRSADVAEASGKAAVAKAEPQQGRLLLIEDNSEVAEVVSSMLTDSGYTVTRAVSAAAALAILGRGGDFDVLLSDIVMDGGLSGLELAQRLRRERPELPVILMTGYSEALTRIDIKDIPVLSKPFAQQDLLAALTAARRVTVHTHGDHLS